MRGFLVRLAKGAVGEHAGDAVDARGGYRTTLPGRLQLLDQLGLAVGLAAFLVNGGQFHVANVGAGQ
ncbi:hypothetical protein D3C81_2066710 [compost metagenome]